MKNIRKLPIIVTDIDGVLIFDNKPFTKVIKII
jgi:ribonucleotide monophosphatase NagD (HAD superfamily)